MVEKPLTSLNNFPTIPSIDLNLPVLHSKAMRLNIEPSTENTKPVGIQRNSGNLKLGT